METTVSTHPLVRVRLAQLRDIDTPTAEFRKLTGEIAALLTVESTKNLPTEEVRVRTPLSEAVGSELAHPHPLIVPVMRAGLGMLTGVQSLLPSSEVAFLGMRRDEVTLRVETYLNGLPENLNGRPVILLDPMLATGATMAVALDLVLARGAGPVSCICILGSPEGLDFLGSHMRTKWEGARLSLHLGALDDKLNRSGFIVPGLGDAGDRLFGD